MSNEWNPYAPPTRAADSSAHLATSYRREGDSIVIPASGAVLPPRCVKCNAPGAQQLKRRLFWHPPGYYVLAALSPLIYVIVALIVRKKAEVSVFLCERHRTLRRTGILVGWLGSIACLGGMVVLIEREPLLGVLALLAFFGCVVVGALLARVVIPKRIDKEHAWVRVGRPFLESL
jgi:hypothetical protein